MMVKEKIPRGDHNSTSSLCSILTYDFPLGGMTIDSSKSGEHDKNLTNLKKTDDQTSQLTRNLIIFGHWSL